MPYITKQRRIEIALSLDRMNEPKTAGELNFLLTMLCLNFLENQGENYTTLNAIVGALESCKLEMYRRKVASYEDEKIKLNGDVF